MASEFHRCDSWVDWQGGKSSCMLFWAGREIHQETLFVTGLCTSAHLFIVSQWSFHVHSCEFGVLSRGSGTSANGQYQPLLEISQCLLLCRSSVSLQPQGWHILAQHSRPQMDSQLSKGLIMSLQDLLRAGEERSCVISLPILLREHMHYNLLSSILMPVESLCCIKPQPVEECPFEAAVAQFRAWH